MTASRTRRARRPTPAPRARSRRPARRTGAPPAVSRPSSTASATVPGPSCAAAGGFQGPGATRSTGRIGRRPIAAALRRPSARHEAADRLPAAAALGASVGWPAHSRDSPATRARRAALAVSVRRRAGVDDRDDVVVQRHPCACGRDGAIAARTRSGARVSCSTPSAARRPQHELRVRVSTFPVGEWDGGRLADADPMHLGLLIADGVLAREVVLGDTVSTELLGPGRHRAPVAHRGPAGAAGGDVRWNALSPVRLGLIDRRTTVALGRFPEIGAVIVDRLSERAHRLAVTQAISQLNRVDRRLLALFWHLAERWGRVARDGIAVPLVLSHRLIGELVGARRPTVSTALAELARDGQLVRRDDGTWLLTGEPVAVPGSPRPRSCASAAGCMPTPSRRSLPASRRPRPPDRLAELQTSLEAARGVPAPPREPGRPAGGDRGAAPAHGRAARAPSAARRRAARGRRPATA